MGKSRIWGGGGGSLDNSECHVMAFEGSWPRILEALRMGLAMNACLKFAYFFSLHKAMCPSTKR